MTYEKLLGMEKKLKMCREAAINAEESLRQLTDQEHVPTMCAILSAQLIENLAGKLLTEVEGAIADVLWGSI